MYYINTSRKVLIDSGHPKWAAQQVSILKKKRLLAGIDTIFHTHTHPDHLGAHALLQKQTTAKIAGSPGRSRARITTTLQQVLKLEYHPFSLDVPLTTKQTFDLGNETLTVVPTPGHCNGHLSFFLDNAKILFAGDLITHSDCGVPDIDDTSGTTLGAMEQSLHTCMSLKPALILPGHGPAIRNVSAVFRSCFDKLDLFKRRPTAQLSHSLISPILFFIGTQKKVKISTIKNYLIKNTRLFVDIFPENTAEKLIEELTRLIFILELKEVIGRNNDLVWLKRQSWLEKSFKVNGKVIQE